MIKLGLPAIDLLMWTCGQRYSAIYQASILTLVSFKLSLSIFLCIVQTINHLNERCLKVQLVKSPLVVAKSFDHAFNFVFHIGIGCLFFTAAISLATRRHCCIVAFFFRFLVPKAELP